MSRWITIVACLSFLMLTAFSAQAVEQSQMLRLAQADDADLPRNIELKEGAKVAEDAKSSDDKSGDDKTRQIVTEGKEATPEAAKDGETAAPADAAKDAAPADAAAKDAAPPAKDEAPPPAAAAKDGAPPPGAPPPGLAAEGLPPGDIVLLVQTELHRVGCDPGPLDEVSGADSPARRSQPSAILPRSRSASSLRHPRSMPSSKARPTLCVPSMQRRRLIMRPHPRLVMTAEDMAAVAAMAVAAGTDASLQS